MTFTDFVAALLDVAAAWAAVVRDFRAAPPEEATADAPSSGFLV